MDFSYSDLNLQLAGQRPINTTLSDGALQYISWVGDNL